jgi:glycosyltransferase involved in cell wall biosynthesis
VDGTREVLRDNVNGLLIGPPEPEMREPARLLEALRRLLADPALRRTLGREDETALRRRFNAETMVDAIESLYGRLIRARSGRVSP